MRRGVTLIELMVTLAVLGISGLLAGDAVLGLRRQAQEVAQRERALQWLEFEAATLTSKFGGDPTVRAALMAELPDPLMDSQVRDQATVITVSWGATDGLRHTRSLAVLTGRTR
jgi:prepilin-type N-terminal cleavage/methylation domain-containing protein